MVNFSIKKWKNNFLKMPSDSIDWWTIQVAQTKVSEISV